LRVYRVPFFGGGALFYMFDNSLFISCRTFF
jgi:hypothetical protein